MASFFMLKTMFISESKERELVVHILNKDYPDIATEIKNKILLTIPTKRIVDLDKMAIILSEFKEFFKINITTWINKAGELNLTKEREMLAISVVLCYSPTRVISLDSRVRNGVMNKLCKLTNCPKRTMSPTLSRAIVSYKAYKDFREQVTSFYNHLVSIGLFKNGLE